MSKQPVRKSFYLIAVLLPFVILALAEGSLRIAGYGKSVPLFIESTELQGYLQPNPNIIQRYFADAKHAPDVSPDTVFFKRDKSPESFRVVIQGGSTAAGFPFGRFGSLQGMLEQRFKRAYPDQKIEVINTALAAVNSYSLLDFVDEIIEIKPDLILIYAGHNEYLGVLGVGSAYAAQGGRAPTLAFLKLKELRLFQFAQNIYTWWKSQQDIAANDESRSLMSRVAQGKRIEFDSSMYHDGVKQFEGNLDAILAKYQGAGIPIMLGNLVSNEKAQPPFSSVGQVDWTKTTVSQIVTMENHQAGPAATEYHKGLVAVQNGALIEAKRAFSKSRDLDDLRFRAPSVFNHVIERLSRREGVTLVDVDSHLRTNTTDGLISTDLMLEHVHPTLEGYFLIGDVFFRAIESANFFKTDRIEYPVSKARSDVPLTELDERWADLKIAKLKSDYPFRSRFQPLPVFKPQTELDFMLVSKSQGTDWLSLQRQLLGMYKEHGDKVNIAKVSAVVSDVLINSPIAANEAASAYRNNNEIHMSSFYQRRALELDSSNPNFLLNEAHNQFLLKRYAKSLALLKQAKSLGGESSKIDYFISKVKANLSGELN